MRNIRNILDNAGSIKLKIKAITNEGCAFWVDDSTGEKVEVILFAIHHHCVACIVASL